MKSAVWIALFTLVITVVTYGGFYLYFKSEAFAQTRKEMVGNLVVALSDQPFTGPVTPERVSKVTEACNKYYAELMDKTNTNTIYVGTIRAMFMLDKLKCDIPARVSGAFPQP